MLKLEGKAGLITDNIKQQNDILVINKREVTYIYIIVEIATHGN